MDLSKKRILVTGASRGIGKAVATYLVKCGAHVAVHYNKSENAINTLVKSLGAKAHPIQANLCHPLEVIRLFIDSAKALKGMDAIVNNAGVAISSPVEGEDVQWVDDWSETMMVNLNATALICKKAIEYFIDNGGGRIINMSSRAAFRGDTSDYLAYAASKGGVVALTRSIARAYGKQGVKAFNIAPGFVHTDMAQTFIDQYGENFALGDIALQNLTKPEDIAPTVAFFCSGLADHATGCTLDINAGSYVH